MITVAVRELKNNLSHYLRDVKRGRPIALTERGRSVAILMPAENHSDAPRNARDSMYSTVFLR